jgi:hypothetical protein
MKYIRVKWIHSIQSEPVLLYSELDDDGWETRKVEIYSDGKIDYAGQDESKGDAHLSLEPLPSIAEIAEDAQFEPIEIDQREFDAVWAKAHS